MISAFLIALREGVEAALVVGIVLVYLGRTGRGVLSRWVWGGVAVAVASSLGLSIALERWQINQEGFEGLLLLAAAAFVVTMIVWMNRIARHLRKEIETRIDGLAANTGVAAGFGLALFVFLLVVREGIELALILRAVELSSDGIAVWIGTALGLTIAIAVGVFFFQGTLKIPLAKFFSATTTILILVAIQLTITGVHELSESMWLPSSKTEMALVGPIVRNDIFFFAMILGAAALLVLREWFAARAQAVAAVTDHAERRRLEWERRKQRRWASAAALTCTGVILILAAEFVYNRVSAAPPPAELVRASDGMIRIPLSSIADASLHFFRFETSSQELRFVTIRKPDGSYATALDACLICGPVGYRQEGSNVICRNCGAAVYVPTIGEAGGCNPVAVPSHTEDGILIVNVASLAGARDQVPH